MLEWFRKCTSIALRLPIFVTFYNFIAKIIINRLNFCDSNSFIPVTLAECKLELKIG